jgi:hypothetical protein
MSVIANAEQGSVAMPSLAVDDPEGGINITGLRNITLTETAEASNQQVIFTGWTASREVTRGQESHRTGAARLWTVSLADQNSLIGRRIMRGGDANRPAETDVARVQWLLTTTEFGSVVTTSRYVSTLFPVAMDAVDYRDQSNQEILDDCSQASGKNYFVMYDEPVAAYGLYYDFAGTSKYRSALRLTNILGYVDNDITFGVSNTDTKLNRDPSRVYSGVVLPYVGGEVYVQNAAIANAFVSRDTMAPSVNVKTSAKATARANRYIADASTETDVISTSFKVPLSRVNHLKEGMAVQVWLAHFPGYDTGWNWMRVLNRTVTATSEEFYTIEVELAAAVGGLLAGGGLTSDGAPYPAPPIVASTPLQSCVAGNGLTYSYTAAGTRTALGPSYWDGNQWIFVSTTFLNYWQAGGSASAYPLAGQLGAFYAGYGGQLPCNTSDGIDYTGGGADTYVTITVVGPGTLTIATTGPFDGGAVCANVGNITAVGAISRTGVPFATDSKAPGTTLTIVVPNDGECAHYVTINRAGGAWGFVSATWG